MKNRLLMVVNCSFFTHIYESDKQKTLVHKNSRKGQVRRAYLYDKVVAYLPVEDDF